MSDASRKKSAFHIVNWLRSISFPIGLKDLVRLIDVLAGLHRPAVSALFMYIDPNQQVLRALPASTVQWQDEYVLSSSSPEPLMNCIILSQTRV